MIELLLALIASLLAVIAIILTLKRDVPRVDFYEDEQGHAELARAIHDLAMRVRLTDNKEIQVVSMPEDWTKAMTRVQSMAVDIQGMIALCARYLVLHMPADAYKDLEPPEEWLKKEVP
jgi:hypothetical protein